MVVKQYCAVIFAALYADENDLIDPVRTGQASKRRFYARNVSIVSSIILGLIGPLLKLCEGSIAILRFVTCYPLIYSGVNSLTAAGHGIGGRKTLVKFKLSPSHG
jgi:hypothetical protein